jgi:hypothetical protein
MTRTAREVLQQIEHVLGEVSGATSGPVDIDAVTVDELRHGVEDALTDLEERPQPEPVGTAREAVGGILDVATRLTAGLPERDRLIELVYIAIADLEARPQQDRPGPAGDGLEMWQRKDAVELALRWVKIEKDGAGVLARVAQVVQIMRGETPTPGADDEPAASSVAQRLAESWEQIADSLPHGQGDERSAFAAAARQLRYAYGLGGTLTAADTPRTFVGRAPLAALAESWMELRADTTSEDRRTAYGKCARQLYRMLGIERG